MEYMTAKSYRHMKWDCEPFEEKGKMYVNVSEPCAKCGGKGYIPHWGAIDGGICYDCMGAGVFHKKVRVYTEKEINQQETAKKKLEERRLKELEMTSEKNKAEWMFKHNFNENGLVWCIFGDDTYAIKDWLKERGCRFDPILMWYSNHPIDVPAGYGMFSISFDEIYDWDMYAKTANYKETAKNLVERRRKEAEGPSKSQYVGEVGERLRNITAIYKSARGFAGQFGWTNIYTFESADNILVWFTTKDLELEKGAVVDLTATVKKHEEFRGVATTQITRAIVKEIK